MKDLAAEWNACRRDERRGDHHGLDLGEGLETGVLEVMRVLSRKEQKYQAKTNPQRGRELEESK